LANEKSQNINDAISDIELVLDSLDSQDSIGIKIGLIDRLIKFYAAAGDTKKVLELAEAYKQTLNIMKLE